MYYNFRGLRTIDEHREMLARLTRQAALCEERRDTLRRNELGVPIAVDKLAFRFELFREEMIKKLWRHDLRGVVRSLAAEAGRGNWRSLSPSAWSRLK